MRAIVSIHDVMPATFQRVVRLVEALPDPCRENLLLLVVPGLAWCDSHIEQMRSWQREGVELAGHGWVHEVVHIQGAYHRLHSLLISRRAAEHLSFSAEEIEQLMCANHAWFGEHGLVPPETYVPPAWALGPIDMAGLRRTPFRFVEVTSGIIDVERGSLRVLPLVGFEADSTLRRAALSVFNWMNRVSATDQRPLRISIHPFDTDYLLANSLERTLLRVSEGISVDEATAA